MASCSTAIDLQEKLATSAGKAKRMPFLGPDKVDLIVKLGKALADDKGAEFVVP